jgi:hypothetical protein
MYWQSGHAFLLLLLLLLPAAATARGGLVRIDFTGHVHSPFDTESISSSPRHGQMAHLSISMRQHASAFVSIRQHTSVAPPHTQIRRL